MENNVLVIASNKGGVDKTTLTVMSSILLAEKFNKKILVVDNDSQANATISLGIVESDIGKSIFHMYTDEIKDIGEVIYKTDYENIDIIPSTIELQRAEQNIKNIVNPNEQMKERLTELRTKYDYILIDNGAFINTIFINSLIFADRILIPTKCEQYSEMGMMNVFDMIETVNKKNEYRIEIAGIIQTFYENNNLNNSFRSDLSKKNAIKDYLLKTKIHKRVCVAEHFEINDNQKDLFNRNDSSSKKAIEEHISLVREVFNIE